MMSNKLKQHKHSHSLFHIYIYNIGLKYMNLLIWQNHGKIHGIYLVMWLMNDK